MDLISHALWSALLAKLINFKKRNKLKIGLAALFGALPDIFAFAPVFIYAFYQLFASTLDLAEFFQPENFEPPQADTIFINRLTFFLYELSHSLLVFLLIFSLVALIYRKLIWEMGAWLLHILIDIPTHSFAFYPTPFLWPFSNYKFDGLSWAHPLFLLINYFLIFLVWWLIKLISSRAAYRR